MQNSSLTGVDSFFKTQEEALHYVDCSNSYKYSILGHIDEIQRYSRSNYEFLLYYPEHSAIVHWQQKLCPLNIKESNVSTDAEINGLKLFTTEYKNFKGLMVSEFNNTHNSLLDGDKETLNYWKYSVGIYKPYSSANDMPGYSYKNNYWTVYYYELLMRIPNRETCNIQFTLSFIRTIKFFVILLGA